MRAASKQGARVLKASLCAEAIQSTTLRSLAPTDCHPYAYLMGLGEWMKAREAASIFIADTARKMK